MASIKFKWSSHTCYLRAFWCAKYRWNQCTLHLWADNIIIFYCDAPQCCGTVQSLLAYWNCHITRTDMQQALSYFHHVPSRQPQLPCDPSYIPSFFGHTRGLSARGLTPMYALFPDPSAMPSPSPRFQYHINTTPIAVAARSKAWVYGLSLAGTAGSNPAVGMDVCLLPVLFVVR
jgi:hypothetical protein